MVWPGKSCKRFFPRLDVILGIPFDDTSIQTDALPKSPMLSEHGSVSVLELAEAGTGHSDGRQTGRRQGC
jgi:hypothetical protein